MLMFLILSVSSVGFGPGILLDFESHGGIEALGSNDRSAAALHLGGPSGGQFRSCRQCNSLFGIVGVGILECLEGLGIGFVSDKRLVDSDVLVVSKRSGDRPAVEGCLEALDGRVGGDASEGGSLLGDGSGVDLGLGSRERVHGFVVFVLILVEGGPGLGTIHGNIQSDSAHNLRSLHGKCVLLGEGGIGNGFLSCQCGGNDFLVFFLFLLFFFFVFLIGIFGLVNGHGFGSLLLQVVGHVEFRVEKNVGNDLERVVVLEPKDGHGITRFVFHLLVDLCVVAEGIVSKMVLRGFDDNFGVESEDKAHDQGKGREVSVKVFSVVVNHDASVGEGFESKVGNHVPHGVTSAEAFVLKTFSLVEPLSDLGTISVFVTVGENHRNEEFSKRKTLGVDGSFVIEVTSTHHQSAHEWQNAVKIHKILASVKVGKVVGVAFEDESSVVEIVLVSVDGVENSGRDGQTGSDGLPVGLEGFQSTADELGVRS
mmetsp:Transcript_9368/g.23327  ORF Transcript_9368/g.23327 Transcript_9368/m.23327 type:complete len:483 (-) Transcript_9368:277-1725(-)